MRLAQHAGKALCCGARAPQSSLPPAALPIRPLQHCQVEHRPKRVCVRLPGQALLLLITVYQRILSPALPVLFGPSFGCRFSPTCSHYAADAVRERGALIGAALTVVRLLKCTPLHPGGHDPVPPRRTPRCTRITA